MKFSLFSRLLTFLVAVALLITSPLNSHALAATSKKEAQQFNIDRVAEVILVSLDGKKLRQLFM